MTRFARRISSGLTCPSAFATWPITPKVAVKNASCAAFPAGGVRPRSGLDRADRPAEGPPERGAQHRPDRPPDEEAERTAEQHAPPAHASISGDGPVAGRLDQSSNPGEECGRRMPPRRFSFGFLRVATRGGVNGLRALHAGDCQRWRLPEARPGAKMRIAAIRRCPLHPSPHFCTSRGRTPVAPAAPKDPKNMGRSAFAPRGVRSATAAVLLLNLLLAGPAAAGAGPRVVASIKPVHSLVSAVMDGVGEPHLLMRGAGSHHDFSLRPSDAAMLEEAAVVFLIDERMEFSLAKPIETLAGDARVVELSHAKGLIRRPLREGGAFEENAHHHHGDPGHHDHDDPRGRCVRPARLAGSGQCVGHGPHDCRRPGRGRSRQCRRLP